MLQIFVVALLIKPSIADASQERVSNCLLLASSKLLATDTTDNYGPTVDRRLRKYVLTYSICRSEERDALLSVGPDIWFSPRAESGRRPETVCDHDTTLKSCSANAHLCTPAGKSSSRTTAG